MSRTVRAGRPYSAKYDPVAGTAYYLAVALFAIMPLLVDRRSRRH